MPNPRGFATSMTRLLLVGVAALAFATLPTLSASAMPLATSQTLPSSTASSLVMVRGHHLAPYKNGGVAPAMM
jgi:hypothetical protein